MQGLTFLKEAGFTKDALSLTMVACNQNIDHIDDFYKLCENLNVNSGVRQFSPTGRALINFNTIGIHSFVPSNQLTENDLENIRENLQCRLFCRAGKSKFSINEFGNIYPCLFLETEDYKIGNILQDNLSDILSSKKYSDLINKELQTAIVDKKSKCKDCNVRYFCMNNCPGMNNSLFNNDDICDLRCKQMKPYLSNVIWND